MNLPIKLKEISVKDWIWIAGAGCSVIGSWFLMKYDVDALKAHAAVFEARQEVKDREQDINTKEAVRELRGEMRSNTDEIKQEIRDLRQDVMRQRR